MIEDLVVTTWTHSSYDDVWPMYYGQYETMAPFFKHAVLINKKCQKIPTYCKQIINNEKDPFYKRLVESLCHVESDIILFSLEDFILYDYVNEDYIQNMVTYLRESKFDFIRLMKSGIDPSLEPKPVNKELNLYQIPFDCHYLYSLQATLWEKQSLVNHMVSYEPKSFLDAEERGSVSAREHKNLNGLYLWDQSNDKIAPGGSTHYNSTIFPYTSTALHGGSYGKPSRWQTSIYKDELSPLFDKYNIDPGVRGEC